MQKPRNFKFALFLSLMLTSFVMLGTANAFATGPIAPTSVSGDLSVSILPTAKERAFAIVVCNNGTDPIVEFTLDLNFTNYDPSHIESLPVGFAGTNAADSGTFDKNTGVWQGSITAADNCIGIGAIGQATGAVGQTIQVDATILSSVLDDLSPNVDPTPGNDTASYTTDPIILDPDFELETRLVTTGVIESGDTVEYELTVKNIGEGDYSHAGSPIPFGVYYILPEGTTYENVVDQNTSDNITISSCGSLGNVSTFLPAFAGYNSELAGCQFNIAGDIIPAGYEFKLTFRMTATGPFSTGDTQVIAIVVGDDADTLLIQVYMYRPSNDPFAIVNNNVELLSYDGGPLTATINPCVGNATTTNVSTACFKVSFNKPIYEPSFTIDALVLQGPGNITSFTKTGNNEWTVQISGLVLNQNTTLSIDLDAVQDYSAVQVTQVLGVNTVRYTVDGAVSSLPETGVDSVIWQFGLFLMILGAAILFALKKENNQDSEKQLLVLKRYSNHHY